MSGSSIFQRIKTALQAFSSPPAQRQAEKHQRVLDKLREDSRRAAQGAEAARREKARKVLAEIPPWPAGPPRNFIKTYEASPTSETVNAAEVETLEGIVFDTYPILGSRMDGSDDSSGFDVVSGEQITSWEPDYSGIRCGKAVRIKYVKRNGEAHQVLEVWVEQ